MKVVSNIVRTLLKPTAISCWLIANSLHAQVQTTSSKAIDSISILIKADKQDTFKVRHLNELSKEYQTTGDLTQATKLADSAVSLAQKLGSKKHMANAFNTIGSIYYLEGIYPRALENHFKALAIYQQIIDKSGTASALGNIGNVFSEMGNYPQALEYYMKALAINTEVGRKKGIATVEGNIGIVYSNMQDFSKALDYYNRALLLDEELKDKNSTAADLANIGNINARQNDDSKALDNYSEALKLYAELGNKMGLARLTGNVGEIYIKQENYKEAEKYLNESLVLSRKIADLESEKHIYQVLSKMYAQMHDWQKAYENYILFSDAQTSLVNIENTKKTVQAEMNYEFEQKQAAEKAEQDKKDLIQQAMHRRQRILTLLIAVVALLLALTVLFIFRSLKAAQKAKLIVEQQKGLMELKALRAQMNPHFIFNALNSIQHFILKNDPEKAQKHLTKFSKLVRKVLENSKHESIPLSEEIQMLELYTELETVRFSSKFNYKFVIDSSINPEKILISPLIIQPFVENAIWHGLMHLKGVQGELTVKFEKESGMLKCTIDDNGIGRKHSQEIKTEAEHEPMGLSITHERIGVLNEVYGINIKLDIKDKTNADGTSAGTRVELLMPLAINN